MKKLLSFACILCGLITTAQVKIGDNPTNVNPRSLLELESTTKGLLLPRMTNTQIRAMSSVPAGMLVFSSTDSALYLRRDTGWAILSLAANQQSATNQWTTNGSTLYNTSATKVGIGTNAPNSQLANNAGNTFGSDGYGGNPLSFSWAGAQQGYIGQFYNSGTSSNPNGVVVKVSSTNATALDVNIGTSQSGSSTPLLTVKGSGRVGIGNNTPAEALDVTGNIKYSGNLLMGVQYATLVSAIPANYYGTASIGCPTGTKLIGGGAGADEVDASLYNFRLVYSGPDPSNTTVWRVIASNLNSSSVNVRLYAICAKVQ